MVRKAGFGVIDRLEYRKHCSREPSIPLFSRDWWLDAVCGEGNWNAVLVDNGNGRIVASLPYYIRKNLFNCSVICMPPLTQTMGPWIMYPEGQKTSRRISYEIEILDRLIDELPPFVSFNQSLHFSVTNWLPFYWKGFQQTTAYTYIIDDLTDAELLFSNLDHKTRNQIRNAHAQLRVVESDDIDEFYDINRMTFARKGLDIPYSLELVQRIDACCKERNCRKILLAKDSTDQIHAASFMPWYEQSAYDLMCGSNPRFLGTSARSLLVWEGIVIASNLTKRYDFEGSMGESTEPFVRGFGGRQVPYFRISKTVSDPFKRVLDDLAPKLPFHSAVGADVLIRKIFGNQKRSVLFDSAIGGIGTSPHQA